ncbi:hypothetical protein ACK31Q_06760 [Aeromonas caviae]
MIDEVSGLGKKQSTNILGPQMAVNQAKIFEQLEQLTQELDGDEFIYSFLTVFGFPKATISRIRNGNDSRNLGKVRISHMAREHLLVTH